MGLQHDDVAFGVTAHALGFAFVRLWHLPGKEKSSIGRKLLHTPGHVHDKKIVLQIECNRSRFVELPEPGPARAQDLNPAEELAVEWRLVGLRSAAGEDLSQSRHHDQIQYLPGPIHGCERAEICARTHRPRCRIATGATASPSNNTQSALTWAL